jgi:uncharacterized protein
VSRPRRFFEYWAHDASLLPIDYHSLLRSRMGNAERGLGVWRHLIPYAGERGGEAQALLSSIVADGPLAASDVAGSRSRKAVWEWSDAKSALEWLFWAGLVTSTHRRSNFERVYDLPERALPRAIVDAPTPDAVNAKRQLIARSARALGIATAGDLRDYFRLSPDDARLPIEQLVQEGEIVPVQVRGWSQQAHLHRDALSGRRLSGQALLSPFDPLVRHRLRAERLFGISYRLEIYTPAEKRIHGYYVLPFLLDGEVVARVDLKENRQASVLRVQRAHLESGAPDGTAERLIGELQLAARWPNLSRVEIAVGDAFAEALLTLHLRDRSDV